LMSFHMGVRTRFPEMVILLFDMLYDTQSTVLPDNCAYDSAMDSMDVLQQQAQ
jgi:hypothetical protein